MAEEGHVDAASIRELHEMEEQLHRLYASTCSVAARQEAVHALALVLDSLCELGGAPSCTDTAVERRLTHTVLASRTLRGMIEVNEKAMGALDGTIAAQQGCVDAKGGLARSSMGEGLAAECGQFVVLLDTTHAKLDSALRTFRVEAAREARAAERRESRGKHQAVADCEKKAKKVVTVVGVKTKETGKARPALPRTPFPRAPPVAPPPPPPSLAANTLPDASDTNTKLDLRAIKHGALLRDIQKQGCADRDFVEPRTISRDAMLLEIQRRQRTAGDSSERAALPFEEPPPPSPLPPRAQSPQPKLRPNSPNSPNRHPSKRKYVPPTLKATTQAISAVNAFSGFTAGKMLNPKSLQMKVEPELEPEPEPEPTVAQKEERRRRSMLDGHSVEAAVKAVQDGSELTMYLATGKKKHSRFFWVQRSSGDSTLKLCWGKKKGTSRHKTETLHAILPEPDVSSAEDLFREADKDNSNEIDASELQKIYERARGEKLPKAQLKKALQTMDADSSGTISFAEFQAWWNRNGGDLQKLRSRAFAIKAGDLTLLLVAEKSPWEASRNAWLLGCAELLGGMTVPNQTTRLSEQPQQQGDPSEQPSHQAYDQPVEPHLNEGQESIADEPDHIEEQEQIPGQEQQDAAVTAWYEEVGNVLWCQYSVEDVQEADGQPLVEFEDLLSGAVLDLTQHDKPEHYWYWDEEESAYITTDTAARVQMMDADLQPYF